VNKNGKNQCRTPKFAGKTAQTKNSREVRRKKRRFNPSSRTSSEIVDRKERI